MKQKRVWMMYHEGEYEKEEERLKKIQWMDNREMLKTLLYAAWSIEWYAKFSLKNRVII